MESFICSRNLITVTATRVILFIPHSPRQTSSSHFWGAILGRGKIRSRCRPSKRPKSRCPMQASPTMLSNSIAVIKPRSHNLLRYRFFPPSSFDGRSEEHTSELQSLRHLVCRLLLEKKK